MKQWTSALVVFLLVACGGGNDDAPPPPDFTGTFTGTVNGVATTAKLKEDDGKLSGTVSLGNIESPVTGTVEGNKAKGTATNRQMRLTVRFEAVRDGDTINWTSFLPNGRGGELPVQVTYTRQKEGAPAKAGGGKPAGEIDPRLVGSWRHTLVTRRRNRVMPKAQRSATDVYCTLAADGSYQYGGAVTASVGVRFQGGQSQQGPVVTGKWKADGTTLFVQPAGAKQWFPVGTYSLSGNSLSLRPPGGEAQLWQR